MDIFISLVVFGVALYLFFITNNKIKGIRENIIIEDARKEIESLITEFNSAAARNIELIESKIAELQEHLQKANNKINQLDEKIGRANKPIVIEKIIERKKEKEFSVEDQKIFRNDKSEKIETEAALIQVEKTKTENAPAEKAELSRSEQLKKLINDGKTKEELMALGYMENEINLLSFLSRKRN